MKRSLVALLTLVLFVVLSKPASAQIEPGALAQQSLRAYWHVFIAYAIAWALIFGWVVSLSRRLGKAARELES